MSDMRPERRRLTPRLSRAFAALAAIATLLGGCTLIAGCGSSASLDPVARAAEVSEKQAGVRFTLEMQLSSPQLPSGFTIDGSGYANQAQKSGRFSIDLSGIPGLSSLAAGGARIEAVFLDPVIYMHMPFLAGKLPQGKTWIKLDTAKAAKALGGSMPQALSFGQTDPTQFLQYLRASSGEVRRAGTQQLDGVRTTRYVATLQLSRVLEQLPAADRAAEQTLLQHAGVEGEIPVEVWVDTQGRVRRVLMSIDVSGAGPASDSLTVTVNFTSYGPVPAISPPPAGEVADLTSMLTSGLAGLHAG